ncbi:hypothetical protein GJ25_gp002 [Mycobacterium phage Hawkeye]|uniref:Uncharacterized protein n=1 Tax=Mycobacterium phage Hawkeye TaxID=1458711 RepID=X2KRE2_9CAUD|nr:hypothetical protein GJ25_gp002 [Mycobacterium phage Hawkeye]AHN84013.1 hypothetical protein PBI_HAWKEYE_2 [Mycobacterium phage Hawkeye]
MAKSAHPTAPSIIAGMTSPETVRTTVTYHMQISGVDHRVASVPALEDVASERGYPESFKRAVLDVHQLVRRRLLYAMLEKAWKDDPRAEFEGWWITCDVTGERLAESNILIQHVEARGAVVAGGAGNASGPWVSALDANAPYGGVQR